MDKFGFFNSVGGDRKYDADDISNFFYNLISDGVFVTPASNLKVSAFRDMQVQVGAGYAMIKAKYYKADADNVLTLDTADPTNARIDRVVLTLNYAARNITLNVKKGTPAQSPTAPALSRTEGVIWEIALADIAVAAGATAITAADITDTRPDSTLCGYITGLIDQIDTTELFSQFTAAFNTWFANLTETLTVNVSVQMRRGVYTTATSNEAVIPITVPGYDPTTDALTVYINGLRLIPGVDYAEGATTITLANAISDAGTKVFFEALVDAVAPADIHGEAVNSTLSTVALRRSTFSVASQEGWFYSQDNDDDAKTTTTQTIFAGDNTYLIAAVMYRGDSVSIAEEGWEKIVDSEVAEPSGLKQKIAVYGRQATEGRYTVTVTQSSSARMGLKLIALAGASGVSVINNILIPSLPYTAPVSTGKRRLYLASSIYALNSPTEPTTIKTTDDNLLKAEELRFTAFYDSRKSAGNISEFVTNLSDYNANTINFITLDITEV